MNIKDKILAVIDFFYPPFRRIMPLQTFRYAACGGANVVFGNFVLFAILFNSLFHHYGMFVDIAGYHPKAYNVAFSISSVFTFIVGFLLNKYVVFTTSNLRGHVQLFRYFVSFVLNYFINLILLKVFVEYLYISPVISQRIIIIIVTGLSYLTQMHFTFRIKKGELIE